MEKKIYITPTTEFADFQPCSLIATSLPGEGILDPSKWVEEEDVAASQRASEFWDSYDFD